MRWLVMAAFAAILGLGMYVPIYNDEISMSMIAARGGWDGWTVLSMRPVCGAFGAAVPVSLLPGRLLAWGMHAIADTPLKIRASGVVMCLMWLAIAANGLARVTGAAVSLCGLWLLALCSLGVLPFLMVLTRPEMPLSLAIAMYFFLPFFMRTWRAEMMWLVGVGYVVLGSWFLSAHPKALIFVPLMLPVLWQMARKNRAAAGTCLGMLVVMLGQAYGMWAEQLACSQSALTQARLRSFAVLPDELWQAPWAVLQQLVRNVIALDAYVQSLLFHAQYGSGWLPGGELTLWQGACNLLVIGVAVGVFLITPVWVLRKRSWNRLEGVMPLLLWGCLLIMAGLQTTKNFYDVVPMALGCLLCAGVSVGPMLPGYGRFLRVVCTGSMLSMVVLGVSFSGLPALSAQAGRFGQLPQEWKSSSVLGYGEREKAIVALGERCGIVMGMAHVVVDQFTYLAYRKGFQPFYEMRNGVGPLQHMGVMGAVMSCLPLPPAVQSVAVRDDGFCCVSREALMGLQAPTGDVWNGPK